MRPRSGRGPRLATLLRYERIWETVAAIPAGSVATYKDVACLSGMPRGARQVGRALRECPPDLVLPWHRVLGAGGRIALKGDAAMEQRERLEREQVPFAGGRVNLRLCRWERAVAP